MKRFTYAKKSDVVFCSSNGEENFVIDSDLSLCTISYFCVEKTSGLALLTTSKEIDIYIFMTYIPIENQFPNNFWEFFVCLHCNSFIIYISSNTCEFFCDVKINHLYFRQFTFRIRHCGSVITILRELITQARFLERCE